MLTYAERMLTYADIAGADVGERHSGAERAVVERRCGACTQPRRLELGVRGLQLLVYEAFSC
jgi:hypothetical protein